MERMGLPVSVAIFRERVVSLVKVPAAKLVPVAVGWVAAEWVLVEEVVELLVVLAAAEGVWVMAESAWVPGATR
jgi:hypothetical protein